MHFVALFHDIYPTVNGGIHYVKTLTINTGT